jgi:hypothetical protein
MKPTISVIIPTYNRASLVQQAVDSVLQQRGDFAFEIIVIDDGSTPETAQGLQRFGDAIRYVRQYNAGLNPARNHGLQLASGEFVALLDDDDIWLPFKTEMLMAALRQFPQAGFAHSNFYIWRPADDSRRPDGLRSWFPRRFDWHEMYAQKSEIALSENASLELGLSNVPIHYGDVYYWSLFAPMVLPSTAIVRRSALGVDTRFPEVDSVGDWEFFARLSQRSGGVFVPTETTLNRSHEDAVRLTRVDPSLRLKRRVALITRLWRQDAAFMQSKAQEVDQVEAGCLRKLAKLAIANGNNAAARESLRALRKLTRFSVGDAMLWTLACLPFSGAAVAMLRTFKAQRR